jgi:RNA polymerase sigma factor (TIGR02999 family)
LAVSGKITRLLKRWSAGDSDALHRLIPAVYEELHRIAHRYLKNERAQRTLQSTGLVNEVYLRLVDVKNVSWQDRAHFFAVSAQMMRRILVDAARARATIKRGARARHEDHSTAPDFDEIPDFSSSRDRELIAIDEALEQFEKMDPRKAKVIELRFFGGLSVEETAKVLKISPQSVIRDWKLAKAWLRRELRGSDDSPRRRSAP